MHYIFHTRVLNLSTKIALQGKLNQLQTFYDCSTCSLKNIRKVICGSPQQTLKTHHLKDLQPQNENTANAGSLYASQKMKKQQITELCLVNRQSHFSFTENQQFMTFHCFLNISVRLSISLGFPLFFFWRSYFTSGIRQQVSCQNRGGPNAWKELTGTEIFMLLLYCD